MNETEDLHWLGEISSIPPLTKLIGQVKDIWIDTHNRNWDFLSCTTKGPKCLVVYRRDGVHLDLLLSMWTPLVMRVSICFTFGEGLLYSCFCSLSLSSLSPLLKTTGRSLFSFCRKWFFLHSLSIFLKNLILTRVRQEKVHQGYSLFAIPTHLCKIYLV